MMRVRLRGIILFVAHNEKNSVIGYTKHRLEGVYINGLSKSYTLTGKQTICRP